MRVEWMAVFQSSPPARRTRISSSFLALFSIVWLHVARFNMARAPIKVEDDIRLGVGMVIPGTLGWEAGWAMRGGGTLGGSQFQIALDVMHHAFKMAVVLLAAQNVARRVDRVLASIF
jgi:hypothetical protein